jgi:PAS domain S-box-containing protein
MSRPKDYAKPVIPINEAERLLALKDLKVLDTTPELQLDDVTLLASKICGTPIALISLVDENRQWFKSHFGLDATETPREIAFCAHAINMDSTLIVEDAHNDSRFSGNPLVVGAPYVRFYAGSQLTTSSGYNIGTLCVIDHSPKVLTPDQILSLEALARQVILNFEFKSLERKMFEREKFLGEIFASLPDLINYTDTSFRYRYLNPTYEKWFNLKTNDILGKTISEAFGEGAFLALKPKIKAALRGEKQEFQSTVPYLANGQITEKSVQIRYIPDCQANGEIQGFFTIATDVTQLKAAETSAIEKGEKLREALNQSLKNEKSFNAIFENSPIGIIQLDPKLRFVAANSAYSKFLGYSKDELLKMSILDVTHPEDLPGTFNAAHILQNENGALHRFEKRYIHKSGKVIWGLVTSRGVTLGENNEQYLFSVVEDITDSRERDAELNATQARLVSAAKMATLGEMAGGIAHEINNPLAIISAKTDIIMTRISDGELDVPKLLTNLNVIKNTTDRIANIVRGLRSFSRNSEADPAKMTKLNTILDDTIALCKERFQNANVDLQVDKAGDYSIECRATQISQVIMNLLGNSFDAIQNRDIKWVKVSVTGTDQFVNIKVTDCGDGITKEVVEKIMEPFFTTKEVGKGTGLGLSISKGIAESHHGHLTYDSNNANTCFVLELPLKQPKSNATSEDSSKAA